MAAVEGLPSQDFLTQKAIQEKQQSRKNSTELTINDFYKLMAAQLQYQDMNNPTDTSEMMSTIIQSQMIQAITNMSSTNTTSYAASLVGKQVTIAEVDVDGKYTGDKVGVVSGVVLGDNPLVVIDGKSYSLSQIMAVGEVPSNDDASNNDNNDNTEQKPTEQQPDNK